jgi:hypothetical protein
MNKLDLFMFTSIKTDYMKPLQYNMHLYSILGCRLNSIILSNKNVL